MAEPEIVTISALGAQGDGIATLREKQVYVPFALAHETVSISGTGARRVLERVITPSPDRIIPFCPHFGRCGGCQVQHLGDSAYVAWKVEQLASAFAREGLTIEPQPLRRFERDARKRAVLTASFGSGELSLGFAEKSSHSLVDVDTCPILVKPLNRILPQVRSLLQVFKPVRKDIRVHLLSARNGTDIALSFSGKKPDGLIRAVSAHPAVSAFARISINGETVLERDRPILEIGRALVSPPPEAFVQASASAEAAMAELVSSHLAPCNKVADLFSGFGTFALRLAENSLVHAAESDGDALAALDRAWRETGGKLKAVTHEKRDLYRRPMMAKELKGFDGAVFDPPRAGAEAQALQLAQSGVRKIAAVSCNPVTLARDLRLLVDGGYRIVSATPIDQFAYTPHLECVILLEKR